MNRESNLREVSNFFFIVFCFQESTLFLISFGRVMHLQKLMSSFGYFFMVVSALGISLLAEELLGGKMLGVLPVMLRVKVLIIYFFTAMLLGGFGQVLIIYFLTSTKRMVFLLCNGIFWAIWVAHDKLIFEGKVPDD
ncbi:hypothetical protein NC651_006359 [Populus alba x Populus x berolinensis]|nr:hypothetical protein NC651_006359 [Populus alba x Populus x berolinensis]